MYIHIDLVCLVMIVSLCGFPGDRKSADDPQPPGTVAVQVWETLQATARGETQGFTVDLTIDDGY